jgi:hypothetical protein
MRHKVAKGVCQCHVEGGRKTVKWQIEGEVKTVYLQNLQVVQRGM